MKVVYKELDARQREIQALSKQLAEAQLREEALQEQVRAARGEPARHGCGGCSGCGGP